MSKINIAVMSSSNGTDMQAMIDDKSLPAEIKVVICNKHCGAIERAEKHGIPAIIINQKQEFDEQVTKILEQKNIDLILMIGYMRIVSASFVHRWKNKIFNIHPSLLPAFKGGMDKDVHQQVLDSGCKITGCTLHIVT